MRSGLLHRLLARMDVDEHDPMIESPIEFPLCLVSELDEVSLSSDVRLSRMDDATRLRLFGIESVELDADGRLKSFGTRGNDQLFSAMTWGFDVTYCGSS